jgi:uncharacterized protein YndB with AHSA1/START domain
LGQSERKEAIMTGIIQVNVSHHFRASSTEAYKAWLDPEKVRVWLSTALREMKLPGDIAQIRIVAQIGGAFLFSDMRDGVETRHWGTYLELEYPRIIAFTWNTVESDEFDPNKVTMTGPACVFTLID